jgi:cytochrome b involved in lipid metabolism
MNQILFSVIGFLMFAIVGIGAAEVKIQMAENSRFASQKADRIEVEDVSNETRSEVTSKSDLSIKTSTATEIPTPPTTVPEALSQVVHTVSTALTSDWGDDSNDSRREDDDEYEDEWEEEDEDEDRSVVSAPKTSVSSGTTQTSSGTTQPTPTTPVSSFTMAQVATHNSATSCYSVVEGGVYDLTSFVSKHPGGQSAIKSLCGVDGTAAFSNQHGGQGKPSSVLAQYKIGIVQ